MISEWWSHHCPYMQDIVSDRRIRETLREAHPASSVNGHWSSPPLRCGTGGSMRACHAVGPGSIPGRDKIPGWGFFGFFSSPIRQMSGSFRPQGPGILFGHHYHHQSSFITGANDLRCWSVLKLQIYINTTVAIYHKRLIGLPDVGE